jgi:5-methyltetrahydropteroyltriglutamate--homocysteine methyltransferase
MPQLPLIPTTVIGSHGTPSWLFWAHEGVKQGRFGPADIEETLDDAVRLAIADMENAGVDVISDGEMRRVDFVVSFYDRIANLEKIPYPRLFGFPGPDQLHAYVNRGRIGAGAGGFGLVDELRFARRHTAKPLRIGIPGPVTLAFRIKAEEPYRSQLELAADLVPVVRREAQALAAAGADSIQIDEPCFVIEQGGEHEFVRMFNECVEGVTAPVCLHLCFGNFRGRPATSHRTYQPLAPFLEELQCRQVHLEFANRNMAEVDLWEKHGGGKELVAGVVDVKGRSIETPEIIAGRIRTVLAHCPKDKLWLAPDCGFSQTARWVAVEKLKAMVEAAAMVRQELDGS